MTFAWPPLLLTILWAGWLVQAVWCCWNQWAFADRIRRWNRRLARTDRWPYREPAVVITPIKGAYFDHEGHMRALLHQDYPAYRVLFVVESEDDPAYTSLKPFCEAAARERSSTGCMDARVLVAGLAEGEGQKVHNLLHALKHVTEADGAIVFADVDAVPDPQWLKRMVDPLRNDDVGVVTGYRWFVPEDPPGNLPTRLASVLNSSVATLIGPDRKIPGTNVTLLRRSHAWGGSTAIRRETLISADVPGHWRGALSDDYQMTHAMGLAGKRIQFLPTCLIASPARFTWGSLMEFGRRQHLITRVHAPFVWLLGLTGMLLNIAGWSSVIIAAAAGVTGWGWGLAAMATAYAADVVRGSKRRSNVRMTLGEDAAAKLKATARLDMFATPLWMALHGVIVVSSAFGRRITWAGITYAMSGRQKVRIVRR